MIHPALAGLNTLYLTLSIYAFALAPPIAMARVEPSSMNGLNKANV